MIGLWQQARQIPDDALTIASTAAQSVAILLKLEPRDLSFTVGQPQETAPCAKLPNTYSPFGAGGGDKAVVRADGDVGDVALMTFARAHQQSALYGPDLEVVVVCSAHHEAARAIELATVCGIVHMPAHRPEVLEPGRNASLQPCAR